MTALHEHETASQPPRDRRNDHTRTEDMLQLANTSPAAFRSFMSLVMGNGSDQDKESALANYLQGQAPIKFNQVPSASGDDVSDLPPAA